MGLKLHEDWGTTPSAISNCLTVAENLAFWAAIRDRADTAGAVAEALERLGISHLASVPGRFLSAGQKRRVNLARILATPVPLWLLDEPAMTLDRAAVKNLYDATRTILGCQ